MRLLTPTAARSPWSTAPARSLFFRQQRPVRPQDGVVTAFRDGQVTLRSNRRSDGFTNAVEEIGYQGVRSGDLVIHAMDGFAGAVGVCESDGKASPVVNSYTPSPSVDARYYAYLLRDLAVRGYISSLAKGIRERSTAFDVETFRSLVLPVPPVRVQRAIADYLDTETTRIDTLITKKQRMIELLQDRFEASILHAVTRGVRGSQPLRPANLPWLVDVPAAWGTPTVSMNFELQLGKMLNAEAASGVDQYAYVRNINVQWDRIDAIDLATMHFSELDRRRCELRSGDVLICEGGEVGRAAVWADNISDCYFQKAIHRARPRDRANSRFLMYCLRAAAKMNVFAVQGNLSTIVHLTGEQLAAHRFPWPPDDEQTEIVDQLDSLAEVARSGCQKLTRQIDLLRERRQALITAAVTGELEVPGVAA